jgi:hypothetical protein
MLFFSRHYQMQMAGDGLTLFIELTGIRLHSDDNSFLFNVGDLAFDFQSTSDIHRFLEIYVCQILDYGELFRIFATQDPSHLHHLSN